VTLTFRVAFFFSLGIVAGQLIFFALRIPLRVLEDRLLRRDEPFIHPSSSIFFFNYFGLVT